MSQSVSLPYRMYRKLRFWAGLPTQKAKRAFDYLFYSMRCNICGWRGRSFAGDRWHPQSICPHCRSQVRHRLLWAVLRDHPDELWQKAVAEKKVLHFAPEPLMRKHLQAAAAAYETADFFTEGYHYENITHNLDISAMPEIADATFDSLFALDVLEHVPEDRRALREIYRILRPGGYCFLTVPQQDNLETTFEDPSITDPEERKKQFGQFDHVRIYGQDFVERMKESGFSVSTYDEQRFSEKQVFREVLFPRTLSEHPLATNYRKIFVGQKP